MLPINLVQLSRRAIRTSLFIFVMLFGLSFTSPVFAVEILFITGSRVYESDNAIQNSLESHGAVTVIQDREAQYTDALQKDLVVISESVYSRKINTTFRNLPVPIIVSEPWLFSDMGMTGSRIAIDFGRAKKQSRMIVCESGHDLTAGLSGELSFSYRNGAIGWGAPVNDALKIATLKDDPVKCTMFAYDKGAQMEGLVAPAKRIGLFLYRNTASFLTSEGWGLFHAAVEWALSEDLKETVLIDVVSDATWKSKVENGVPIADNWYDPDYDDSLWEDAYAPFPEPDISQVSTTDAAFIWYWPSSWGVQPEQNYYGLAQAWFRKTFELPGDPSSFKVQESSIASGGPVDFYINGNQILKDTPTMTNGLPLQIDISQYLIEGENVIAIQAREAENTTLKKRYKGVWFNLRLEATPDQNEDSAVKKALLVAGRTPLNYSDRALKMRLEHLGFLVYRVDDATVEEADANDMDLILISETVWSKRIGDLFADVAVPVLCLESYLYDDLYMSGAVRNSDYGKTRRRHTIDVHHSDSSLSAGMSKRVKVTTRRRHVGWGVPAESAIIIASLVGHPERAAIFAYNKGAPMINDYPAPANRVGLFMHGNSASRLTAAGWDLFDAAVNWAVAEPTDTREASGLDFTAIGGKRQGREATQSLKTTRWNRVLRTRFGKPNKIKTNQF